MSSQARPAASASWAALRSRRSDGMERSRLTMYLAVAVMSDAWCTLSAGHRKPRRLYALRQVAHRAHSGYTLARMRYEVLLAPEAVEDLRALKANLRAEVREAMETHLRHEPTKTSKSRIKRLSGQSRPQYRLRVGEARVFYDVEGDTVQVLAIVAKSEAESWLARFGSRE